MSQKHSRSKKHNRRVIHSLMTFPTFKNDGRIVRKYRYLIIALLAFGAALMINNHGLQGVTFGAVLSRVVEALGDVFADRGFNLES